MKRRYWTDLAKAQRLSPTKVTADFSGKIIKQRRDLVMFRDTRHAGNPQPTDGAAQQHSAACVSE